MTSHDVSSIWPQNIIQSISPFNQAIGTFHQSIAFLSKLLPLFSQAISNHKSTQPIAILFQEIAFVSWPTSPINCLDDPIDCRLPSLYKWFLPIRCHQSIATFGQAIAHWQIFILKFS